MLEAIGLTKAYHGTLALACPACSIENALSAGPCHGGEPD
jgi:hypothetical protein